MRCQPFKKKVPLLTRRQTYHQCDRTPHPQPTDPSWRSTQLRNPTKTNILLAFGTQRYMHEGTVYSVTSVTAEKTRILSLAQSCTKPNLHHLQHSRQCKLMSCAHFNCPCSWVCNSNRAGFNGGNIYKKPYKIQQMSAKIWTFFRESELQNAFTKPTNANLIHSCIHISFKFWRS